MRPECARSSFLPGPFRSCRLLLVVFILCTVVPCAVKSQVQTSQQAASPDSSPGNLQDVKLDAHHGPISIGICCRAEHLQDLLPQPGAGTHEVCSAGDASPQETELECESSTGVPKSEVPSEDSGREASAPEPADGELLTEGDQAEEEEDGDRHNFASAKDGAKIVAANKEAKKPSAVLDSDSDTYLRNECKADKWLAIELSQVAKIDAVEFGQYELYSSRIRDFELSATLSNVRSASKASFEEGTSRILNSPHWQSIANFTAAKLKGLQTFKLRQPTWCKFLLLRWINQHGTEPVCALNDLRVYGKSAAEDLEDRLAGDLGAAQPADAVRSSLGNAWTPPLDGDGFVGSDHGAPVRLAPSTLEVVETLSSNGTTSQVLIQPQPPLEPPPGMQLKPGDQGGMQEDPASITPVLPAAEGVIPPSQRAVLIDPPAGVNTHQQDEPGGLPGNGAGSSKQRNGGSVYDMLVQEIKATKLQQKTLARQLQELQQNLSGTSQEALSQVGSLREELAEIRQQVMTCAAQEPASNATDLMHADTSMQLGLLHQELQSLNAKLSRFQTHQSSQQTVLVMVLAILLGIALISLQALPHLARLGQVVVLSLATLTGLSGFWTFKQTLSGNALSFWD